MLDAATAQNREIILYEGLDRTSALGLMNVKFSQLSEEEKATLKANGEAIWLLRESSSQKGMVVVEYYTWEEAKKENNNQAGWDYGAVLLAYFDNEGWVSGGSLKKDMPHFRAINNQNIDDYIAPLLDFAKRQKAPQFILKNLVNSRKEKPTKTVITTSYIPVFAQKQKDVSNETTTHSHSGKRKAEALKTTIKVEVDLTSAMKQAITCPFRGKTFRDPVTMNQDVWINGNKLEKGVSYERKKLEKLGVNNTTYYDNLNLKFAVNRVGCNDAGKIESFTEERLQDPVEIETMADPQILPSGHSFSKKTIAEMITSNRPLKCPISRDAFTSNQVVDNINLKVFISAWPECKTLILAALEKEKEKKKKNEKEEEEQEIEVKRETKKRRLR